MPLELSVGAENGRAGRLFCPVSRRVGVLVGRLICRAAAAAQVPFEGDSILPLGMICQGRKRGSRSDGFIGRKASGRGRFFPLLLFDMHQVWDTGRAFCCVRDKLRQHRCPGRACSGLALCNVSARDAGTMTGTSCWSSIVMELLFSWRIFQINVLSCRRGQVDLRWRRKSGAFDGMVSRASRHQAVANQASKDAGLRPCFQRIMPL